MDNRYDIAIIGSGPAGLSAAINAKIRNKKIIIFGIKEFSNKLIKAPKINNYLGFYDISGIELKEQFEKHIDSMGIEINYEKVNEIYAMGDYFSIVANNNSNVYESSSLILATGMEYTKPINGEEDFLGKGVGYCATCDAPLYRGKIVTIIGYSSEAEEEANFVSEVASKVYYVPMYKELGKINSEIEIVNDVPVKISGGERVDKLILKEREISTDGIFVLKDSVPPSQLVPGIEIENTHIKVDKDMKTNIDGCFACGDCTGKPYQYMKSSGEGQVAALNAVKYIDER